VAAPSVPREELGLVGRRSQIEESAKPPSLRHIFSSLSIEGYRVTPTLIERVRSGNWNPETNEGDREQRNAMAARGYWQAFQAVQTDIARVLKGENPGQVADAEHSTWHRELFAPSVASGILKLRILRAIGAVRSTSGSPTMSL